MEAVSQSINVLNTKLTTIIGFGGVLLKFAVDLPDASLVFGIPGQSTKLGCLSCLILKITVCLLSTISICLAAIGLLAKEGGGIVRPRKLLKEWLYEPDERCRLFIARTWRNAIEELDVLRADKARRLNQAILALSFASATFALDVIVAALLE